MRKMLLLVLVVLNFPPIFVLAAPKSKDAVPLPDKPVPSTSLTEDQLSRFRAPFDVSILPHKINKPIGPLSFTSGSGRGMMNQLNKGSGFEPMVFRPKLRPIADDMDKVILGPRFVSNFKEGFLDGCRIRVYHPINGKMEKVRDARVAQGGHHASGWKAIGGNLAAGPKGDEFIFPMRIEFRPGVPYWFKINAVNKDGEESEDSDIVKLVPQKSAHKRAKGSSGLGRVRFNNISQGLPQPPAPANFRGTVAEGVATLQWDPRDDKNLKGYRIYMTSYDPANHKGYGFVLDSREPRPDQKIQKGDIVFVDWEQRRVDQKEMCANDDWFSWNGARVPTGFSVYSDHSPEWEWAFVEHPRPIPDDLYPHGRTCLMFRNDKEEPIGLKMVTVGGTNQTFYPVLEEIDYKVEAWVRGEGGGTLQVVFHGPYAPPKQEIPHSRRAKNAPNPIAIEPLDLPVTEQWTKVAATFRPPAKLKEGLSGIYLSFKGPGKVYIDNLKLYDPSYPAGDYHPMMQKALKDSGMSLMRTHELIKTKNGYTLSGMTEDAGGIEYAGFRYYPHTFLTLLRQMREGGGVSPWLQIEMCLDEDEWMGFMEWMAAPYDPKKDTPKSKPWAYKRWKSGQKEPWLDIFPRFAFELSNETWNGMFAPYAWEGVSIRDGGNGGMYSRQETYGLFQQYVIDQMKKCPYWKPEHEEKTLWVLGGWGPVRFANEARFHSPDSEIVTYASYNHNSGLGPAEEVNDFKRFYMMQWPLVAIPAEKERAAERAMRRLGFPVQSGVYEYGAAYHCGPGHSKAVREADQRLARNLPMATAILDASLLRAEAGHTEQSFFTYLFTTHTWGSHTKVVYGGHAYPFWKALCMYNHYGTGAFLQKQINSVPAWDFPEYETMDNMSRKKRPAMPNAPLISAYATAQDDRVTVMLISRKMDTFPISDDVGYTPVTVRLPFKKADTITLYRLTGDTRADDRFEEIHKIEKIDVPKSAFDSDFKLSAKTGADDRGLPPASIFFYVFEGRHLGKMNSRPDADFVLPRGFTAGKPSKLTNLTQDRDGDKVTYHWALADAGESSEPAPTVNFPTAKPRVLKLTADDGNGGIGVEERKVHVPIEHGGMPLALAVTGWKAELGDAYAQKDGEDLLVTGAGSVMKGGRIMAASMEEIFGDFTIETEIKEITPASEIQKFMGGASPVVGGLVIGEQPFGSDMDWAISPLTGIFVGKDGSVRTWRNARKPAVPAGSLTLPARVKIDFKDRNAIMQIERNGQWYTVDTVEGLPSKIYPGLVMTSGNMKEMGTVRFGKTVVKK